MKENKCSTKPDVRQDFSKPPAGVTDAAPTARRHGAGKPQTSAEAVADRRSRSGKQGVRFRGAGNFFARTGRFSARTGRFCAARSASRLDRSSLTLGRLGSHETAKISLNLLQFGLTLLGSYENVDSRRKRGEQRWLSAAGRRLLRPEPRRLTTCRKPDDGPRRCPPPHICSLTPPRREPILRTCERRLFPIGPLARSLGPAPPPPGAGLFVGDIKDALGEVRRAETTGRRRQSGSLLRREFGAAARIQR